MTRLRILFDADDVAETLLEGWVKTLNERYGTTTSVEDVTDWDVSKAFPTLTKQQIYGVLQEDEVWAKLTPMPGAQEYLKRLHNKQMVMGDVLIDDGPHNLVNGPYFRILFDQPHNRGINEKKYGMYRAVGWEQVYQLIHENLVFKPDDDVWRNISL